MTSITADGASIRRHNLMLGGLAGALALGVFGWAASTQVSGAVVSHGSLVSASFLKKVQHPTGGVVKDLLVHEGQQVREGELLIRLDDTQTRANLAVFHDELIQLQAKRARLLAEQAAATGERTDISKTIGPHSAELNPLLETEGRLLEARRLTRDRQKAELIEQQGGATREIDGFNAQARSHQSQIGLINDELSGVKELYAEGYASISTLKALERQAESLSGERGQLMASSAEASNKIAQYKLQSAQIDAQHLSEVLTDLTDAEGKIAELKEKEAAADDQLRHVEIRAPQGGFIHDLAVHTIGGVITAGEPIMMIVPYNDTLSLETRIQPQDIDQVTPGASARVKFSAFNRRSTPEIMGVVSFISPDLEQDQRSGASYYLARINLPASEVRRLGQVKLMPGMPAEVYVHTRDRTVLSFLTKPFADQVDRTFREK